MDEVYYPNSKSYHCIKEKLGIKIYSKRFDEHRIFMSKNWFNAYQELHNFEPRVVEIYSITDKTIFMKHIDGVNLQKCINEKYYLQMLDILNNIRIFNQNKNPKFYHIDASIKNCIVKDNVVYLIDPDSFRFFNF